MPAKEGLRRDLVRTSAWSWHEPFLYRSRRIWCENIISKAFVLFPCMETSPHPHTLVKTTTAQQQSKERRNYIRSHCVYVYTIMWTNAHRIQIKKIYEQPQQIYKYIWWWRNSNLCTSCCAWGRFPACMTTSNILCDDHLCKAEKD